MTSGDIPVDPSPLSGDLVLSRWEWIAIPSFGIHCMKACLDMARQQSTLACDHLELVELEGNPGVKFRIRPFDDDQNTFVVVEAPLVAEPRDPKKPTIRTLLILGEYSWRVELELVPKEQDSHLLTLGRASLGNDLMIDPNLEEVAGLPKVNDNDSENARSSVKASRISKNNRKPKAPAPRHRSAV